MHIVKWLAAAAAASVLAGCASQPEIPFDKSVNANIHTIGIVPPSMHERPNIWLASDMGQSFGLIGALVDVSMQEARNSKVWAMLQARGVAPKDVFEHALEASVKAQGFEVKTIDIPRKEGETLKSYPATGADAYLDVSVGNYGYVAAGIRDSTPYRPFVYLNVKLVRPDGSVLMQDQVLYDPVAPFDRGNHVSLSPDPAYTFTDFDEMEAKPDQVVSGLDASLHTTTDAVGRLLH
jgi:hypothetical protein